MHLTTFVDDHGTGPAVLLLHGQPGTHKDMDPIARLLEGRARVLNADRPGYGQTLGVAQSLVAQAEGFAELLEHRKAAPAVIVAHSFAGGIALLLAANHPELVSGLVLVTPIGGAGSITAGDWVLAAPAVGTLASAITLAGFGLVAPQVAKWLGTSALSANVPEAPTGLPLIEFRSFVAEQRFLMGDANLVDRAIEKVRCPVVVVIGGRDIIIPPAAGRDLAARLSDAELVELAELGHFIPRDAPEVVAEAVVNLLGAPSTSERG